MKDCSAEIDNSETSEMKGSDAISPQAADVVEKVITDETSLKVNHEESPLNYASQTREENSQESPKDPQELSFARETRDQTFSDSGNSVKSDAPSHYSDKGRELLDNSYSNPLSPETSGDEYGNGLSIDESRDNDRDSNPDFNQDNDLDKTREDLLKKYSSLSSSFQEEQFRRNLALESARQEFKQRFSFPNVNEEELRKRYPLLYAQEHFKHNYSLSGPTSPESKSLTTSPVHSLPRNPLFRSNSQQPPRNPFLPAGIAGRDPRDFHSRDAIKKEGLFFCHLCSFAGRSQEEFDGHMTCHFEHICPHCDYKSRTEGRLKRHIKDFHTEENPDGGFGARTMPGRPKIFRCKQCDFSVTDKIEFWNHSRTHIKEDKILQCPRCPFVTEYKHHLEYHLRNHFGSKPFKCPKCNYACVNKSMLNSHMKSHTNVYQYRCADCTYATKYCHSLKLHLRKYNHKPATVLNNDGSLPQGIDATAAGLSLLTKRGPPRGPRGPRKDKMDPAGGPFLSMPPSPIGGLMPGLGNGMMSPFWPVMNPIANRMQMSPNINPLNMNSRLPSHMTSPGKIPGAFQPDIGNSNPLKCNFCSFIGSSREVLTSHVVKVHASENQDLFSMFGISSEALLDENHKKMDLTKTSKLFSSPRDGVSSSGELQIKTEVMEDPSMTSPHSWPDSANQEKSPAHVSKHRSISDVPYSGSEKLNVPQFGRKDESMDILKQMTLKFGSGPQGMMPPRGSAESPLDLTKAPSKSVSPPIFMQRFTALQESIKEEGEGGSDGENSQYSGDIASPSPRKRSRKGKAYKLDTLCLKLQEKQSVSPFASEEGDGSVGDMDYDNYANDDDINLPEDADSNCSEKDGMKDNHSENGNQSEEEMVAMETGSELIQNCRDDVVEAEKSPVKPISDEANKENGVDDFSQIHSNLKILNSEEGAGDDKTVEKPQDEDAEEKRQSPKVCDQTPEDLEKGLNMKGEMRQELAVVPQPQSQNRRKSSVPSAIQRGTEIAWRMLNEPFITGQMGLQNGHGVKNGFDPMLHPWEMTKECLTSTPKKAIERKGDNFECPHCQIAFKDVVMYTMHMGYHGYHNPYKCNMCGECCKDKVDFFLHIARAAHN